MPRQLDGRDRCAIWHCMSFMKMGLGVIRWDPCVYVAIWTPTPMYTYVCLYIYIHVYVYINMYMYRYIYIYLMFTFTCILYIHTDTYHGPGGRSMPRTDWLRYIRLQVHVGKLTSKGRQYRRKTRSYTLRLIPQIRRPLKWIYFFFKRDVILL